MKEVNTVIVHSDPGEPGLTAGEIVVAEDANSVKTTGVTLDDLGGSGGDVVSPTGFSVDAREPLVATGTPNAIVLTPSPAISDYADDQTYYFTAAATNTGAVTANISGKGVVAIKKDPSPQVWEALAAGDIIAGETYTINYVNGSPSFFALVVVPEKALLLQGGVPIVQPSMDALPMVFQVHGTTRSAAEMFRFESTDQGRVGLSIYYDGVSIRNGALLIFNETGGIDRNAAISFDYVENELTIGSSNVAVGTPSEGTCRIVSSAIVLSLPTADPHVVGQLWNSSGTVKISAG